MEENTTKPPQKTTTSEATQETTTKDKILCIRVYAKTYAASVNEQTKMGYKSLSSFAVDRMTGVTPKKCMASLLPDIARLFTDVEESLNYALRLEKRMSQATLKSNSDLVDLRGEIQHFKIFVAKKAEVLLMRVRDEYFNQQRENRITK